MRSAGLTFRATSPSSNGASTDGSISGMLDKLAAAAVRQAPTPYQAIRIAHVGG